MEHEDLEKQESEEGWKQAYNYSERSESGIMLTHMVEFMVDQKHELAIGDQDAIKSAFWRLLQH